MPGRGFLEQYDVVEGFPAVDLQTGANTGDYVYCGYARRVVVIFVSGVGTAGDDPVVTLQQATSNAGGGVKALNLPTTASTKVWKKQAATNLSATAAWADASGDIAGNNTLTNATAAEQALIWVIEIAPIEDMDVAGGFDYLRATVADIGGNAQPGYLCYIVEKTDVTDPSRQPSNIA